MTSETIIPDDEARTTVRAPLAVHRTPSRRWFGASFVLAFAIVWLGVMSVHFLGNPDGIFPSSRNPSRRELPWKARQLDRLVREGRAPSVLVLGSSRMMQVLPEQVDHLTGGRTFNFAAPGAMPRDMLAQLRFALSHGAPIKDILIGVDDQAMFGYYDASHELRTAAAPEVFQELPLAERAQIALQLPALVKPELTAEALQRAFDPPPLRNLRTEAATLMILDDGYMVYPRRLIARRSKTWDPREDLQRKVENLRRWGDRAFLYQNGAQISDKQLRYLGQLLELCRQHQIRVTVILTPVQSDFLDLTMRPSDKQKLRELSRKLQRLCDKKNRASYRDLSRIESFSGLPWEWANFSHALPGNVQRIVNVAYGRPAEYRLTELKDDFTLMRNPSAVNSLNTP